MNNIKKIENIGLMESLTGDEKIFMEKNEGEIEEVNIPIEYFTEHEILDTALRNLILKYNNNPELMGRGRLDNSKLIGFKVRKDENEKKRMIFEYFLECKQYPDEDDKSYEERQKKYAEKVEKGIIKPYKVIIAEDYINDFGLKIKETTFIKEIDRVLDEKIAQESAKINDELKKHTIDRNEWLRKMTELGNNLPSSGLEYMKNKMKEFKRYYEYITSSEEYKEIFEDECIVANIVQDNLTKSFGGDRVHTPKVNDDIPFDVRDKILRELNSKKVIQIVDQKTGLVSYKAYIIPNEKDKGEVIVLEPLDGDKSTFITFETQEFIEFSKQTFKEEKQEAYRESDVYTEIIRYVLGKPWSEKAKDENIITKYHVSKESYERDLRYIVTGYKGKGVKITDVMKHKRENLVKG